MTAHTPISPSRLQPSEQIAVAELAATEGANALPLWRAFQAFCQHHNRARFEAEKQAIRDGVLWEI